jgi:hypothetical protein
MQAPRSPSLAPELLRADLTIRARFRTDVTLGRMPELLTTGGFTKEAGAEAPRDGEPHIGLVDREKLIPAFARAELGVRPSKPLKSKAISPTSSAN